MSVNILEADYLENVLVEEYRWGNMESPQRITDWKQYVTDHRLSLFRPKFEGYQ